MSRVALIDVLCCHYNSDEHSNQGIIRWRKKARSSLSSCQITNPRSTYMLTGMCFAVVPSPKNWVCRSEKDKTAWKTREQNEITTRFQLPHPSPYSTMPVFDMALSTLLDVGQLPKFHMVTTIDTGSGSNNWTEWAGDSIPTGKPKFAMTEDSSMTCQHAIKHRSINYYSHAIHQRNRQTANRPRTHNFATTHCRHEAVKTVLRRIEPLFPLW